MHDLFASAERRSELVDEVMLPYYDMQAQRNVMASFVVAILAAAVYAFTR